MRRKPHPLTPAVLLERARRFRRDPTDAEAKLWRLLRGHRLADIHFRRQYPIGGFIADFCAVKHKLIIEVDGGGHAERADYDRQRTESLNASGFRVLRFWNREVLLGAETVTERIIEALGEHAAEGRHPHPGPPPRGEGSGKGSPTGGEGSY